MKTAGLPGCSSFAVAAILDGVDGYIARRYNQRSELGTMLDPLADKLLLVSGHRGLELRQRAASRPDSALADRHHHRARPAAGHRRRGRPAGGRPNHRAPAHHRQDRHGFSNGRRCFGFYCEWDLIFHGQLAENLDSRRGLVHRRVRPVLRLGRHETARHASGQFAGKTSHRWAQMKHGFQKRPKIFIFICVASVQICGR